jgi:hypothetical protein
MKKVWLISGAVMGLLAGAAVAACSSGGGGTGGTGGSGTTTSTNNTTNSTTNSTTASTTTTTTGGGMGGSTTSSTTTTSGTGTMCKPPGTLHPPNLDAGPGTIYCPFSGVDGGKAEYCMPGTEHCCETPQGATTPSACQPTATACMTGTGYTDWQCEDPVADCPSGQDCCAAGATLMMGGTMNGMACENYASKMHGTACVAAGSCTGIQMCTSDAECGTGKTCIPFSKAGNQVGGCM